MCATCFENASSCFVSHSASRCGTKSIRTGRSTCVRCCVQHASCRADKAREHSGCLDVAVLSRDPGQSQAAANLAIFEATKSGQLAAVSLLALVGVNTGKYRSSTLCRSSRQTCRASCGAPPCRSLTKKSAECSHASAAYNQPPPQDGPRDCVAQPAQARKKACTSAPLRAQASLTVPHRLCIGIWRDRNLQHWPLRVVRHIG